MVAREVGEHRDVELGAVHASLLEPVRRHLHRDAVRTARDEVREQRLQRDGIRRGVVPCVERARKPLPSVPMTAGAPARAGQRLRRSSGCRRSCRWCRSRRPSTARARVAVERRGELADAGLRAPETAEIGDAPVAPPAKALGVPQHRRRPGGERLRDEVAAVVRLARIGDEGVARAAPAGCRSASRVTRTPERGQCRGIEPARGSSASPRATHTSSRISGASRRRAERLRGIRTARRAAAALRPSRC